MFDSSDRKDLRNGFIVALGTAAILWGVEKLAGLKVAWLSWLTIANAWLASPVELPYGKVLLAGLFVLAAVWVKRRWKKGGRPEVALPSTARPEPAEDPRSRIYRSDRHETLLLRVFIDAGRDTMANDAYIQRVIALDPAEQDGNNYDEAIRRLEHRHFIHRDRSRGTFTLHRTHFQLLSANPDWVDSTAPPRYFG